MKIKFIIYLFLFLIFSINSYSQVFYNESFETDFGIWNQLSFPNDYFDWTQNSGFTPSNGTGPSTASDGASYIYIEATGHNNPPEDAIIEANFDFSGTTMPILSFDYHMYGSGIGNLFVFVYDGSTWTEVWNAFNDHGNQWNSTTVCLGDYADNANVKIKFKAQTQYSDSSDIAIDNIEITDFNITSTSFNDVTCGNYFDGDITVNVAGGYHDYEYSIDDGATYISDASSSHLFSGLSGGEYIVRVRESSGCVVRKTETIILDEPDVPEIQVSKNDVFPCPDDANGEIEITATGLYTPFQYSITGVGGTFNASNVFTNLSTGTYQTAVKNTNGCIAAGPEVSITALTQIEIFDITEQDVANCYGDCSGNLTVTAGGGYAPLQYSINEGTSFTGGTFFNGLCAGDYRIIIVDDEGCRDTTDYVTISQPDTLIISDIQHTEVTGCFGDETGSITIIASGGTGQIIYSIDNNFNYEVSNVFNDLPAGNDYHVWVRDEHSCLTDGGLVSISQPEMLVIDSIVSSDIMNCYGGTTGEIHFFVSGGTGAYEYSIDNGSSFSSSPDFTGLGVGTYFPFVKDENDCSVASNSITFTQPQELIITNVNVYDVSDCYNGTTGVIQIFAQNGTFPYQYSVDAGNTYTNTYSFSNLSAGTYTVTVRDFNGCEIVGDTYTIDQPSQIIITDEYVQNVSCFDYSDGFVFVDAIGGTGDIHFSLNDGASYPYYVGNNAYVGDGTYIVKVRDDNGCTVQGSTLIVTEPDSLAIDSIVVTDVQGCYGDETGQIIIYTQGGTEPLNYSVDNGFSSQLSNTFDDLPAQINYLPYVVDDNGCFVLGDAQTIGQPSPLNVATQAHTNIDTCYGLPVGTITVTANGGTGTIEYSIDNGVNYFDNSGLFADLYAGTYNISVKDEKDCLANGWQEIIYQPDSLILDSIIYNDIVCNGQGNGSIDVFAHGGQPQLRYSKDGGVSFSYSSQFYNLMPNTYNIVVKDAYDCRLTAEVDLIQPNQLVLDSVTYSDVSTCFGDSTGTINVFAHGGVPDIEYSYSTFGGASSGFFTDSVFDNVSAGAYYVIIRDAHGCTASSVSFSIYEPSPVELVDYEVQNITCFGLNDGMISLEVGGGAGNYQYTVDNGNTWQTDSVFYNLIQGSYTFIARDSNFCETPYPITVNLYEPTQLVISQLETVDPACYGYENGRILIYPTGGTAPYHYILVDTIEQNTGVFNNLQAGEYWVTIADTNNCVVQSDTIELVMPENLALFNASIQEGCSPLTVDFERQMPMAIFTWYFGDGSVGYTQDPAHTYINKTDAVIPFTVNTIAQHGNCNDTSSQVITVYNQPDVKFELDTSIHYFPDTTVFMQNINTSFTNYQWTFDDGDTFSGIQPTSHSYSECGTFSIMLTAQNSYECVDTNIHDVLITAVEPNAGFNVSAYEGCTPLNVSFSNSSANALSFEWSVNTEVFSSDTNAQMTFNEDGFFRVDLKAYGYCGMTNVDTAYVSALPSPIVDFYVPYDTAAVGDEVGFKNYTTDAYRYSWDFGDSTYSSEIDPFHAYSQPGYYDVVLKAYSKKGCMDSLLIENAVFVSNEFYVEFPNAFSPDGDNINDLFIPFTNLVDHCTIQIYTRRGQPIFRTEDYKNTFWDGTKNGKPLPSDVYLWHASGQYKSGNYFNEVGEVTLIRSFY